jgi:monothiol glutaredoxin
VGYGELIGGCDIILEMFQQGELQQVLDESYGKKPE